MSDQPLTTDQLPMWPEEPKQATVGRYSLVQWSYGESVGEYHAMGHAYQRDRADAAIARLSIAIKALEGCSGGWSGLADKALAAIGEIPK